MNKLIINDTLTALKELADNSVDMGVTSPPYNKQENKNGWLVNNVKYDIATDKLSETEYQVNQLLVLNELYRIIKPGGSFFYNHKIRWEKGEMLYPLQWISKSDWTVRQEIIWDRTIAGNIRGWRFWQVEERIYWLYKPIDNNKIGIELLSKHALLTSIWRFIPERNNKHPAPFPLELPIRCIYSIMNCNQGIIIDPYCGSGTTCVAGALLGHEYIGIDMSEEYIELTKQRINSKNNYSEKLQIELSKHIVIKTFKQRKDNGEHKGRINGKKFDMTNSNIQTLL